MAKPPPIIRPTLTETEKALRAALPRAARPKKASTLILWKGSRDKPEILMGQRAKKHDFMPSVYVYPGGRVDRGDSYVDYVGDLSHRTQRILEAAYSPRAARAVALAAIRETWEETGLMLGTPASVTRNPKHPSWQAFFDAGIKPDLTRLEVIGRATTPPRRHKRFDTWFFARECNDMNTDHVSDSRELENVDWFTIDTIRELPLHTATLSLLHVMERFLAAPRPPRNIVYMRKKGAGFITDAFPG